MTDRAADLYINSMRTLSRFIWAALPIALIVMTAVVVPLKLMDDKGVERVETLGLALEELKHDNRIIKRENDALRNQIHAFHSDPEYVEKIARDELGMIGTNEIIYQFPD